MSLHVNPRRILAFLAVAAAIAAVPEDVHAQPSPGGADQFWLNIDDGTERTYASLGDTGYLPPTDPFTFGGLYNIAGTGVLPVPASGITGAITQESLTSMGAVDVHLQYSDISPLAPGASQTVNFNVFEPENPSLLSDTLSVTFTGQTPTGSNPWNMSVDIHFLSGNLDDTILPPLLPNAFVVGENTDVSSYITSATGLQTAHIHFASVPEPSSLVSAGLGVAVVAGAVWRRRRNRRRSR